jgi:hypothetical protein
MSPSYNTPLIVLQGLKPWKLYILSKVVNVMQRDNYFRWVGMLAVTEPSSIVLVLIALPKVANLKRDYIPSSGGSSVGWLFMNICVALLRASSTIYFSYLLL